MIKLSSRTLLHWLGFSLGIVFFTAVLIFNPFGLGVNANKVVAVALLMITWWVSESLPMPAVALVPLVLFPVMGIAKIEEAAAPYANPVIFLFMGGFMIGLAIEKWNLHKRIALGIVNFTGTSGNRIILGFILATGFLSMWLSNTATTMMMFPIALSVIHVMKESGNDSRGIANFSLCIMLAIAYSANFGGISTIIGTPPNVAYAAFIYKKYNYDISFINWMLICTPVAYLLLFTLYLVMVKWLYPSHIASNVQTHDFIRGELKKLGKLSKPEKRVLVIFIVTALLWITKDLINTLFTKIDFLKDIRLDDNMIAVFGALLMFIVPAENTEHGHRKILEWGDTQRMAWGILLLFGGGISLANAMEKAGLIEKLGNWIASFSGTDVFILVLVVTFISIFISEVTSNVAQVIVMAPVMSGIADALHINPFLLGIPMTLAASCASMMPMGTPPNAIVFASGYIKIKQMMRVGLVMNLVSIILITLFCYFVLPKLLFLAK
ncbi:MAG: DASS family sodium-coupled anion symporter [Chitinophagaceae bacterium]|nr:DASS family sodium-coupled anion symporter [Chitinophagaceae bacterium]